MQLSVREATRAPCASGLRARCAVRPRLHPEGAPPGDGAARVWRAADLSGVEVHRRDGVASPLPRHFHDDYALGQVLEGAARIGLPGRIEVAQPGAVILVNPGEVHCTGPASPVPVAYRAVFLAPALVREAWDALRPAAHAPPVLPALVADDRALGARMRQLHRAMAPYATRLERETRLVQLLGRLVGRHAAEEGEMPDRAHPPLGRARELLAAHFRDDVSLATVAAAAELAPATLVPAFRTRVGLSPAGYQLRCRLQHARRRIAGGAAPALAAQEAGYADYGVFCRLFRRVLGVWPDAYARATRH